MIHSQLPRGVLEIAGDLDPFLKKEIALQKELLSAKDWDLLHQQLIGIDPDRLQLQKQLLLQKKTCFSENVDPPLNILLEKEISSNKQSLNHAACLLVAGGQGTRLGFDGPKGCYPIVKESGQSLFSLHAKKVEKACEKAGKPLPFAIMTSPLNHKQTVEHFQNHHFFGLDPKSVVIFSQNTLPFLNDQGNLFCDRVGHVAVGPNGNGDCFAAMHQAGILEDWKKRGVEVVSFLPVDNPLGDPFAEALLTEHIESENDVTVRVIAREDPNESVGVIVCKEGKVAVIEYSEMDSSVRSAIDKQENLLYPVANISHFCFSLEFMKKVALMDWPLHLAYKKIGNLSDPEAKAWKFELFIFDCLSFSNQTGLVQVSRDQAFQPLKSVDGPHGVAMVRAAINQRNC